MMNNTIKILIATGVIAAIVLAAWAYGRTKSVDEASTQAALVITPSTSAPTATPLLTIESTGTPTATSLPLVQRFTKEDDNSSKVLQYLIENGVPRSSIIDVPATKSDADVLAIKYFTEVFLPAKGVPASAIKSRPTTLADATEIAVLYFHTEYLPHRGVPTEAIIGKISNRSKANEVARNYFATIYLPENGYPTHKLSKYPTSKEQADALANHYFTTDYLPKRGVPSSEIYGFIFSQSMAEAFATNYFSAVYLPRKGMPVHKINRQVNNKVAADNYAAQYFATDYLPSQGVPLYAISKVATDKGQADAIAESYFTTNYLPAMGVPESEIIGSIISREQAEDFASNYFVTVYLPSIGIPSIVVEGRPISRAEADSIAINYFWKVYLSEVPIHERSQFGIQPTNRWAANAIREQHTYRQALEYERVQLLASLRKAIPEEAELAKQRIETIELTLYKRLAHEATLLSTSLERSIYELFEEVNEDLLKEAGVEGTCTAVTLFPVIGDAIDFIGAIRGIDSCTGEEMSIYMRLFTGAASLATVSELAKLDNISSLWKGGHSLWRVTNMSTDVDTLFFDSAEMVKLAEQTGRGRQMRQLTTVFVRITRQPIVANFIQHGHRLKNGEFNPEGLLHAGRQMYQTGQFETLSELEGQLNIETQFTVAVDAVDALMRTSETSSLAQVERVIRRLDGSSELMNQVRTATRAPGNALRDLSVWGKVLRYSGAADDLNDALILLERTRLESVIQGLSYRNFIELAATLEVDARQASWQVWALENIVRPEKPYRIALTMVVEKVVAYAQVDQPNSPPTLTPDDVWLIYYIDETTNQYSLTNKIQTEVDLLHESLSPNAQVIYVFNIEPPIEVRRLLANAGALTVVAE